MKPASNYLQRFDARRAAWVRNAAAAATAIVLLTPTGVMSAAVALPAPGRTGSPASTSTSRASAVPSVVATAGNPADNLDGSASARIVSATGVEGATPPPGTPGIFDWISLGVGLLSLAVSSFAAVFAFRAATKSDRLLKRLVVYPYRELDLEFADLLDGEKDILMQVFAAKEQGIAAASVSSSVLRAPDFAVATRRLVDASWLVVRNERLTANPDRVPYLKFVWESLHES